MPHDFSALRAELDLPPAAASDRFGADVLAEAVVIAELGLPAIEDATAIPFVTIDPPGSRDLDQALLIERVGDGFRVHYAIADLGSVIPPGGAIDAEARRRGQTIYLPDGRVPLHPPVLSEDALSLLPDQVRRAALWTIEVDAAGVAGRATVRRALVRSVARLDYEGVQASVDAGSPHPSVEALGDLGRLRRALRVSLGAIELALPEQEVVRDETRDDWVVRMHGRTEVDAWNTEVSLLTGMGAAQLMLEAGVGLLRTLPPAEPQALAAFLRTARTLGIAVPDGATPAEVLAGLDVDDPAAIALMREATGLLRGAGYESFDGAPPAQPLHAGIGAPYAHVTAPLRRLADRFGTEVCLAICAGVPVPAWTREGLPTLGEIMHASDRRASAADRAAVDLAEVWELAGRVGESFEAIVVRADDDGGEVMLLEPPVVARCTGLGLPEGERVTVTLAEVDADRRRVAFAYDEGHVSG
ncbi:RNB domain-containing ribonuclease [Aeromicrobium fastidiosum]|uniref:RNB domain-containing ribonuclease n=1 Tax=Aeromicrobium fastidiosum TaxID=52699 RepID=A0A641AL16_9ACTN|nr:RNB domain-containing ribonuclease [Aeromicrobium fastidiosum]KAA1374656.1 RNB domain-containing ribonuclease [Aeromicrobium fastidiosum]MBP2390798.1 exoribonuclease R [Aeromicrobium fastidiosum]